MVSSIVLFDAKIVLSQGSPRSRKVLNAPFMDTLDGDDDELGNTIQDTMTISDAAQLKEDAKFHEMTQYVCLLKYKL